MLLGKLHKTAGFPDAKREPVERWAGTNGVQLVGVCMLELEEGSSSYSSYQLLVKRGNGAWGSLHLSMKDGKRIQGQCNPGSPAIDIHSLHSRPRYNEGIIKGNI